MPEAVFFTGPKTVELRPVDVPWPAVGEVLVQTSFTAISPGTEMLLYRGQFPEGLAADETIASLDQKLAYPLKYGYCAVGRVVEHGAGVDAGWLGRSVFSFQPHQSAFVAPVTSLHLLPDTLLPEDAVLLPNMETALSFAMDGAPLAGERVAVLGQGIVGLLTTSLLAEFPLESLVTLDRFPARRLASLSCGADQSLAPEAVPANLHRHFDLVYELTGSPEALDLAIALAGSEGRVVIGSWYGSKRAPVNLGDHFHRGRLKLVSSQVSRLSAALTGRWDKERRLSFALDMLQRIQPSRLITHRFPLAQAAEAYRLIDQEAHKTIQVVIEYV